jgi:hypothetical protein
MDDPSGQREHSAADLAIGVLSKPTRLLGRLGSGAARAGFGAQLSRARKAQKDGRRGWISASELPQSAMSARTRRVKEIWSRTMNENPTVVEQGKWTADFRRGVLPFCPDPMRSRRSVSIFLPGFSRWPLFWSAPESRSYFPVQPEE